MLQDILSLNDEVRSEIDRLCKDRPCINENTWRKYGLTFGAEATEKKHFEHIEIPTCTSNLNEILKVIEFDIK